ncbi:hypothetical protein QUF58_03880 [Anaerolineales bacterium HSG24]|nr:hypothetical protein [Anaerolineales bacterium HSG24]
MATTERTELDPLFKQILVSLGQTLNFTPQTEVEVSRLPRTIDVVIELPHPEDPKRLAQQTPFIRFAEHNQIEFKGKADRLHIAGYQLIRGRSLFYMSEHQLLPPQMSVSIVCAGKPNKLLQTSMFGFQAIEPGYYLGNEQPPTLIIVVNELPLIPKNYPLLLFASSEQKFRQFLQEIMADTAYHIYLHYAYIVRPTITKEEITMAESAYITKENLEFIIQDVGEQLMPLITDTVLIQKSPAFQTLLAEQQVVLVAEREKQQVLLAEREKQQALLAEREKQQALLAEREKQQALLAEREKQQALLAEQEKQQALLAEQEKQQALLVAEQEKHKQQLLQTLLRLLRHRFTTIPKILVRRIETTTDLKLLEKWLDKALEVNDIAEFDHLTT